MTELTLKLMLDGSESEALLELSEGEPCIMTVKSNGLDTSTFQARDFFDCLIQARKWVAKFDGIFLCNGARRDVYPSRMSRQMAHGKMAYKMKFGMQAQRSDLVNIFDFAEEASIGTVEDQEKYYKDWINSL